MKIKTFAVALFSVMSFAALADVVLPPDGGVIKPRKGDWNLTSDGCSHKCESGSKKNCIITGGTDYSGCPGGVPPGDGTD